VILRRQTICHAVTAAYSGRLGVAGLSLLGCLGRSDMVVDAPLAWLKDWSRVN